MTLSCTYSNVGVEEGSSVINLLLYYEIQKLGALLTIDSTVSIISSSIREEG